MQNDTDQSASDKRVTEHAKLLTYENRQVLAYLFRDEDEELKVIVQLWVARTDDKLQICLGTPSDDVSQNIFDSLDDESIALVFQELGIMGIVASYEGSVDD